MAEILHKFKIIHQPRKVCFCERSMDIDSSRHHQAK